MAHQKTFPLISTWENEQFLFLLFRSVFSPPTSPRLGLMPQKSFTIFYSLSPSLSLPLPPPFFSLELPRNFLFFGRHHHQASPSPLLTFPAGFPTPRKGFYTSFTSQSGDIGRGGGGGKNMQTKLFVGKEKETKNS